MNLIGEIIILHNNKLVKSIRKYKSIRNDNLNEKGSIMSFYMKIKFTMIKMIKKTMGDAKGRGVMVE